MNELTVIPYDEIQEATAKADGLKELFNVPTTAENAAQKKAVSIELSKLSKLLDSKRADATKPALEEQRRINGIFKPAIEKLDAMSKGLINQVAEFARAEERKENERKALEAKAQAEALIAGKPVEQKEVVKQAPVVSVSETKVWTYEVVDALAVPRQFLSVDDKKVMDSIKSGVRTIPGLRIFQETRVGRR